MQTFLRRKLIIMIIENSSQEHQNPICQNQYLKIITTLPTSKKIKKKGLSSHQYINPIWQKKPFKIKQNENLNYFSNL